MMPIKSYLLRAMPDDIVIHRLDTRKNKVDIFISFLNNHLFAYFRYKLCRLAGRGSCQ